MTTSGVSTALGGHARSDDGEGLAAVLLDAARSAGLSAQAVEAVTRLSGGASKDMWGFDLVSDDGTVTQLVLRRQPPGRALSAQGLDSVAREAAIVRFAEAAGVPVPGIAFETHGEAGDGYAMARVDGETMGVRVLKLPELAEVRAGMARSCGEILARLHRASGFEKLGLRSVGAHEALAALEARYLAVEQPRPVFDFALAWLKGNLPAETTRVLLHGDFRNGNLVVGREGIRAVLDWELAHVGPPAADLAWLCVPSWRFQRPDLPVGGFGTREDLLAGYASAGGGVIDPAELFAWEVFGTLNWGVMCAGAGRAFMDGARSVEGAVIARRSSETEFDLMRMIEPHHPAWQQQQAAGTRFDDPPARLIIAEVRSALDGGIPAGFAQKVAANALGIAQRELEAEAAPGQCEDPVAALIGQTLARIAVDQPGYPGYRAFMQSGERA